MFVGICKIALIIPGCDSLKGKRHVIRSIKDRVAARFNVAIAETGDLDLWQRAEIGVCAVGNDHSRVNSVIDSVTGFIEGMMVAEVVDRQFEIISF